jgi:6-phosphogluconolactonase
MKFSKVSQLGLVSTLGLLVASLLSGCTIVTIDYVYVACSTGSSAGSAGQIQIFAADAESGALRMVDTAVPSGGTQPVALATTSDYENLYAANAGNNTVVHFAIAGDGSLTQKDTVTLPFTPASVAVNLAGTYLYVVGGNNPGRLAIYSLSSGTIGSLSATETLTVPGFTTDLIVPTGVTALNNGTGVYVAAYDQSAYNPGGTVTSSANPGWVFSYSVGSNGALTPTSGSPYQAGVRPSALTADPTNRFLYVTDFASSQLIGYAIESNDVLEFLVSGPFKTGNQPTSLAVDPRGIYIYVANSLSSSISGYSISLPTGAPSTVIAATGSANNTTDTDPVSLIIDPSLGRYVYTANHLGNSVSGFRLNPDTGALTTTQATPYPTGANPTALAAIPHGNHAVQVPE